MPGSDREKKRKARYVLLGRRGSWFCVPYEDRSPFGGGNEVLEDVLLIKYAAKREGTRPLDALPFRRRVSSVDVVPWDVGRQALDDRRRNRPSWTPMLEAVRVAPPKPSWHADYERAFDWFLDQQEVELLARRYPFIRCSDTGGTQQVRIGFDKERDRNQIDRHRTGLFALFASSPSRRPSFGDFFDSLESGDVPAVLQFFADEDGRPNWDRRGDAFMARKLDDEHIEIRRASGSPAVPERGWLRPKDDFGTERALARQREARPELLEARSLLAQLHDPSTIKGFRHRWREAGAWGAGPWARLQEGYASYARQLGFVVDPCRVRTASDKGKVERRGRDVRAFLGALEDVCFLRLEDLQAATDERVRARVHRLICPVTGRTILASWEAEQETLLALPATLPEPFDVQVNRTVTDDCLVSFEGRQYEVPFTSMRRTVQVRGCAGTVEIYGADGQHLARYPRGTACRLLLDQRHAEGEGDDRVMRPTPLGRVGQAIVLERSWEVARRPIDDYLELVRRLA